MSRSFDGVRTLAGTAALAFALATHAAELPASKGEDAETRLREWLVERVRTIPGTRTQFLVAGFLQLDGIVAHERQDGDEQDTFFVSATPVPAAD